MGLHESSPTKVQRCLFRAGANFPAFASGRHHQPDWGSGGALGVRAWCHSNHPRRGHLIEWYLILAPREGRLSTRCTGVDDTEIHGAGDLQPASRAPPRAADDADDIMTVGDLYSSLGSPKLSVITPCVKVIQTR